MLWSSQSLCLASTVLPVYMELTGPSHPVAPQCAPVQPNPVPGQTAQTIKANMAQPNLLGLGNLLPTKNPRRASMTAMGQLA